MTIIKCLHKIVVKVYPEHKCINKVSSKLPIGYFTSIYRFAGSKQKCLESKVLFVWYCYTSVLTATSEADSEGE